MKTTKRFKHEIKVRVRIPTVRAVGSWFLDAVEKSPELVEKIDSETFKFMSSLPKRTGHTLKLERAFAKRFVDNWTRVWLSRGEADLLLSEHGNINAPAVFGKEALAELVGEIALSLRKTEGASTKLDPLKTLDKVNGIRKKRARNDAISAVAHASDELGVSENTVETALKKGKKLHAKINKALGELGPLTDKDQVIVLTDDGSSGAAIIRKVG